MEKLQNLFEEARTHAARRTDFLRTMQEYVRKNEPFAMYIAEIRYETHIPQECFNKGFLPIMRTDTPLLARFHRAGSRSAVCVWPRAFDAGVHRNLHALFDHEGKHAQEYCDSPEAIAEYMPPEYLECSIELQQLSRHFPSKQSEENTLLQAQCDIRAYGWQIQQIPDGIRNVSVAFLDMIKQERNNIQHWLEQARIQLSS